MTCKHPDIAEYYTARHNAAGRQILHFLRKPKGGLGRFAAIPTNFGRVDGDPEQPTVPERWMLGEEGKRRIMERPKGDGQRNKA
eukprot:4743552-Pyramimonas_sp.AAC.2